MASYLWISLAVTAIGVLNVETAHACPFCSSQGKTFTEELEGMDVAVVAKFVAPPPSLDSQDPDAAVAKAKFEVVEVIKGAKLINPKTKFEALYYGDAEIGKPFLVMAVVEGDEKRQVLVWSTPMKVTDRSSQYIAGLSKVPAAGVERLMHFQNYLEDSEELLARDAYDEFAKSPYDVVKALKPHMNHDQLVTWIKDTNLPATRRRLYLTMLGVCGGEKDLAFLEEIIRSDDKKSKAGLDALLGCYLTLKGADGVQLVEDLYLKNKKAEYADTYGAIMALRFHGTESDVIPVKRIVVALRSMLDRPELADLVIPDLARWEDWESMDRLVALYRDADEKSSWVRTPVVNFVKACPLPEAKEKMKELEKIDPAAVKRANTFFPFGPPKPPADVKTSEATPVPATEIVAKPVQASSTVASADASRNVGAANLGAPPAAALNRNSEQPVNPWWMLGVAAVSAAGLLVVQWSVLVGRR